MWTFSRTRMGVLSLCWLVSVTSGSTTVDTATLRSMGLSRKEIKEVVSGEIIEEEEPEIVEEVDEVDEPWKSNADWWKDPLSMFSDDEEDVMGKEEIIPSTVEEVITEEPIVEEEIVEVQDEIIEEPMVEEEVIEVHDEIIEKPMVEEDIIQVRDEIIEKAMPEKEVEAGIVQKVEKKDQTEMVERKSDSSRVTSPLALLVPLIPKVQFDLSSIPVMQLAASAVVAKVVIESVMTKLKKEEYLSHEGSSVSPDTSKERIASSKDDLDDFEPVEKPETTTEATKMIESHRSRSSWMRGVGDMFARTPDGRRIPSARDLLEQVESLRANISKVESERDIIEKEYEKASFQVSYRSRC